DEDGSTVSLQITERLEQSSLLELQPMGAEEVEDAVHDNRAAAGLIIPVGLGAAVGEGEPAALVMVGAETSSAVQSVRQAVDEAVSGLNVAIAAIEVAVEQVKQETGAAVDESLLASARAFVDTQLANPVVTVEVLDAHGGTDAAASGFEQSSPGSMVNWVLFSLLGITAMMVWERQKGLLRRLNVIGVTATQIIGGKMLAMVMISFLQQLLLVLLGQFAFGIGYFDSPAALLVTMLSLSVFAASFGLLVSVVFRSEQAVIATTVISAQVLAALGGAWFPLEITGAAFSRVAHFLPTAWVMDSLHGITLKSWGIADVLFPMAVVWAWVIVLLALAVWRYRPD
ncbi:MAG: ABC transporter permease, partial [Thermoleophilia bacterium]|nr:ABC transporter permease [Thermoleophilia bacterium]